MFSIQFKKATRLRKEKNERRICDDSVAKTYRVGKGQGKCPNNGWSPGDSEVENSFQPI